MNLPYKQIQLQPMTAQDDLLSEWLRQRYRDALNPTLFRVLHEYYGAEMIHETRDPSPEALKDAHRLAMRLSARAQYINYLYGLHTPVIWTGASSTPMGVPPTSNSVQAVALPEETARLPQSDPLPDSICAVPLELHETEGSVGARAIEWNVD